VSSPNNYLYYYAFTSVIIDTGKQDIYDYEELEDKANEAKKQEEDHPELGSFLDNIEFIHDAIDSNRIGTCQNCGKIIITAATTTQPKPLPQPRPERHPQPIPNLRFCKNCLKWAHL
jgi:hypothetical protein